MGGCEDRNPCVAQEKNQSPTVQPVALQIIERF